MTFISSVNQADFQSAGFREAGSMHLDRFRLADLPQFLHESLYTHPAYLAANGIQEAVVVSPSAVGGMSETSVSAAFADRGRFMLHLGRLSRYDAGTITSLSGMLFRDTDADFAVFEDIKVVPGTGPVGLPSVSFAYQANWELGIAPDEPQMSSSQRRQIRSKARRLAEATGKEVRCEFSQARGVSIDRIVDFNRTKITRAGRRHHMSDEKLSVLKRVCADVGYQALLYCGDEVIAGDIICVSGADAYMTVLGYNLAYERYSPGIQAHCFALTQLAEMGCTRANFLWGDSPWKGRMGATRHGLTTVIVARNRRTLLAPELLKVCSPYGVAAAKSIVRRRVLARIR